jgi:PAS domain S-box-containing protein
MHQQPTDPATEVKRLQRCMNDLVSVLALPAVWSVSEPSQILDTFLDALLVMLDLDFLYARVRFDSHEAPIDALRTAHLYGTSPSREHLRRALNQWSGKDPQQWPNEELRHIGGQEVSVFPIGMGIEDELGLIVAGSQRLGFPEQTESLVLGVAAHQLAFGLQQARRLSEQKRIATELDRRVAERTRELAEINEELQLQVGLLQHLPVSAWTLKPDGTQDYVNKVWLEFSGQTLDFVRSHPEAWMNAVHPEDRETASRALWEGVRSGQGFAFETRSLRALDGAYRWHLQQAVVLRDAEGKVLKFVGTTTDIDNLKRAEEELRASETNLRQIVDSIPGLICSMSPSGEIEQLNRPLLEYFGKTSEELKGWKMTDAVHPDDLHEVINAFTYSVTTGTPYAIEHRCRRADGIYRWFQVRASAVHDMDNNICGWYVLLTDIEDRKLAEEALQIRELNLLQITETIPEMLWSASADGAVDYCNGRLLDYTGFSLEQVLSDGWTNFLHPDDVEPTVEVWKSCLKSGAPYRVEVRTFHAADNTYRWCVTRALPLLDQEGRIVKWHGTVVDMHDWKQAQEELRNTQAELARIMRVMTIGQLTASIAHEVSQPLSGIIMNAGTCLRMLKSDPPNIEGAQETVQRTIRDSNRASEVITRLRTLFSKKQTEVEPLDLNEAAREVIALLSGELERNSVILKQEFSDRLPTVNGDRVQLQQVVLNLLRNASDAMTSIEDRPRQIVLRTELEGEHVRLSVQDSGVGFTPEVAGQMFDSFYTTKSDGMGVGLSVSRSIIEANRGRLWATANEGPGATFAFSIPCEHGSHSQDRP